MIHLVEKNSIRTKILDIKEKRWQKQVELVKKFKVNLISFKLNVPSWPKSSDEIIIAFDKSLIDFQKFLVMNEIYFDLISRNVTKLGPNALLITKYPAKKLKELTVSFEEDYPIGRLLDLDVMNQKGVFLDRDVKRKCLLCDDLSINCMKTQKHTPDKVRKFFDNKISQFISGDY
jgi:holo-ACP synthase CitX